MDRQTIEQQHIVAKYLAGQLDAVESAAFEAHYTQNPETVRDLERILRLKEGLAVLRERGELDELMRKRHYWRPALALAASLAVAVVGAWLWIGHTSVSPLVSTIAALSDAQGRPVPVASTYVLVRTRGAAAAMEIPLPRERSAIELRMIPSSRPPDAGFRVRLEQLDAANAVASLAETHAAVSSEDGFVTAYLDSAHLSPGRYAVELLPERHAPPGVPADRFVIELR